MLAYANEKLEQYTRRDNLRIFNFPNCEAGELSAKFMEMAGILGVEVQACNINIIHHLPPKTSLKHVIVRFNNRHLKNQVLYSKKHPLNAADCPFKGVYIQEDLTMQRSRMFRYLKAIDKVEWVRTVMSEGRIQATLKDDKGTGKRVTIDNPDDFFRIGVDLETTDLKQFRY